jgi:murein DD-endopeptidase MepM/ murein hydrolase activator NlpD
MVGTGARWLTTALLMLAVGMSTPEGSAAGASEREATIATPRPTRWVTGRGNDCRRVRGKGKVCDGPRRVPEAYGADALRAQELGLGTRETAQHLLSSVPKTSWANAVKGAAQPTLLWPVESGKFGRGFGFTRTGRRKELRHDGVDVGAAPGVLVRSTNDGLVAYSDNGVSGYGNMIMVIHRDRTVTFYCHHRANYVFAGQQVKRGQVIGEVGNTGISRGPHLHFEWHARGKARDPMPRMVGRQTRRSPLSALRLL